MSGVKSLHGFLPQNDRMTFSTPAKGKSTNDKEMNRISPWNRQQQKPSYNTWRRMYWIQIVIFFVKAYKGRAKGLIT